MNARLGKQMQEVLEGVVEDIDGGMKEGTGG